VSNISIRKATAEDLIGLDEVEDEADQLFASVFHNVAWPPAPSGLERSLLPGFILVASNSPNSEVLGFIHVLAIAGDDHIEQLSVRPSMARRGIGRALVDAAKQESLRRGRDRITLRTFADVPWNAPFYESCGFAQCDPDTDFLRGLVNLEEKSRVAAHGRRIQMKIELSDI
jgi:GNAT superfamily N-acetyltransferase